MIKLSGSPWSRPWEDIVKELDVSVDTGLSEEEAGKRLQEYGPNAIRETKRKSAWIVFISQFKSLIIALLAAAAVVAFVFGDWLEGAAIIAVIIINTLIGFFTELKSVRSMEALRKLTVVNTKVRRSGQVKEIPAQELVPGDIVILEGGDIITADIRLVHASKLQIDESTLTGESLPVGKSVNPVKEDSSVVDRTNMLFSGTAATRGSAQGVVVATGMESELGKISALVEEAEEEVTPLEKRLDQLGRKLIWVTLIIAFIVAVAGILTGKKLFLMIETAIALAVAAIPEGLPIVATIALARGVLRMARRNAIINRLSAVETLGATSVICTDKTGTLTENRMTVTNIITPSSDISVSGDALGSSGEFKKDGRLVQPADDNGLKEILKIGVLCNNASFDKGKPVGDPLEVSLIIAGLKAGMDRAGLIKDMPEAMEEPFDSDIKMMATFHKNSDGYYVAVKGAPESILNACSSVLTDKGVAEITGEDKANFIKGNDTMAEQGLRILAFAYKVTGNKDVNPYEDLVFVGFAGLLDPPRSDVKGAIEQCKRSGIEVVMVTGDQSKTAKNIALVLGIIEDESRQVVESREFISPEEMTQSDREKIIETKIFARVTPKQKLDLIEIHQKNGSVVAMTGDGVNDAPALKKADIGIAMGQRGTQVAQEASDMILKDDSFSTIVAAIEQGRIIFNNIRKFVFYLISCNVSEVMTVFLASVLTLPLPILPLQILFLNLVTDVFPALALGAGEGDPDIKYQKPRKSTEQILTKKHWLGVALYGFLITVSVLGALFIAMNFLGMHERGAVTVSFMVLAMSQLWHVFNMRDNDSNFFVNSVTKNIYVWGSIVLCIGLLLCAVYVPVLSRVLKLTGPGLKGWMLILGMSLIPLVAGQILKPVRFKKFSDDTF
ncbi:MAG: cation-transporting P-type ATPase [Armatimonadota bacterium]